ncbi:MAG: AAA family ATPase, partial [Coriobacteriia bacterium]|nr:AAA family ATPase [Coriobacteriia bacterium]
MFERKISKSLVTRILEPRKFIQILAGPRQTGKTTAVTQAIEQMALPTHYVSIDDPRMMSPQRLIQEWETARQLAQKEQRDGNLNGALLVLDEVQKITQWSSFVKMLWDEDTLKKVNLKVILTGSSTLLLRKGMKESLMGRFEVLRSTHWNLAECKEAFGYSLEDFLFFGGYPGAASLRKDPDRWADYVYESIIEPTISQDVLQIEEIRNPAL